MSAHRLCLSLIMASLGLVLSCAGSLPNISVESLDASHQFAHVSDHETIAIMNGDGSGVKELTKQSGEIVSPSWSPDGTRIAFFRIESSSILGLGRNITLCFYDLVTGQTDELAEVEPEVVFRDGTPEKSFALTPPVWQSNGRLFVLDKKGVYEVDVDATTSELIVESGGIKDFDLTEDSLSLILSVDGELKILDLSTGESHDFFDENIDADKTDVSGVTCLRMSPSGAWIAASSWKTLYVIDHDTRRIVWEAELSKGIYDVVWDPDEQYLICLTGTISRVSGLRGIAFPSAVHRGSVEICRVPFADGETSVLYKKLHFDVRDSQICLSPDGRWILLVSCDLNDRRPSVYIMPSEGKAIRKLTSGDEYGYPIWRPSSVPYSESDAP